MILKKFDYIQDAGKPNEWKIQDLYLDKINLIVGKNATGKSRVLSVIHSLGNLLSINQKLRFKEGIYKAEFTNEYLIKYELTFSDTKVINEILEIDGLKKLERYNNGEGKIWNEKVKEMFDFQNPVDEISAFKKRDIIQHPFLEKLFDWGDTTIKYKFGSEMGKGNMFLETNLTDVNFNFKQPDLVVVAYMKGLISFGEEYSEIIISDMRRMGYDITNVGLKYPTGVQFQQGILENQEIKSLFVEENDIAGKIGQHEISQGMFRALSILIQFNLFVLSKSSGTILIDDIGEGLDFDRTVSLVELLIEKTKKSEIQLIMSTNDRFIMNTVPLEYWIILEREGGNVKSYTSKNSKEIFERFEKTGLNNFDFFAKNYYLRKN